MRRYLVENNFLNPGDTADAQVYAMALGMMKANGALPQRVKTQKKSPRKRKQPPNWKPVAIWAWCTEITSRTSRLT